MKIKRFVCHAICIFSVAANAALAQAAGTSAANFLLRSPNARYAGLSEAGTSHTSEDGNIAGIHYNPAAAAFLRSAEVSATAQRGLVQDNFGSFIGGLPTEMGKFSGIFSYYSTGDVQLTDASEQTNTVTGEQDLLLGINYAEFLYDSLGMGVTIKAFHSELLATSKVDVFAMDLGVLYPIYKERIFFGASILNLGSTVKYGDDGDKLPLTYRAGVSSAFHFLEKGDLTLSLDVVKTADEIMKVPLGLELNWKNLFSVRAGYKIKQEVGKWSFGFGAIIRDPAAISAPKIQLDYALVEGGEIGKTHTFSLSYKFQDNLMVTKKKPSASPSRYGVSGNPVNPSKKPSNLVAVLNFKAADGVKASDARSVSDLLRSKLTGRHASVHILEKQKAEEILRHHRKHKNCDEVSCAGDIGEDLGVTRVIVGTVKKMENIYDVSIDIVNVESDKVEYSDSVRYNSSQDVKARLQGIADRMIYMLK